MGNEESEQKEIPYLASNEKKTAIDKNFRSRCDKKCLQKFKFFQTDFVCCLLSTSEQFVELKCFLCLLSNSHSHQKLFSFTFIKCISKSLLRQKNI